MRQVISKLLFFFIGIIIIVGIPSANKKKKVQQVAEISNKSEQNLDSYDKATKELVFEVNTWFKSIYLFVMTMFCRQTFVNLNFYYSLLE